MSSGAPFGGGNTGMPITAVGQTQLGTSPLQSDWRMISPEYFRTMRIPLLRSAQASVPPPAPLPTMRRSKWREFMPSLRLQIPTWTSTFFLKFYNITISIHRKSLRNNVL